jgi:hypothetical protein
MLAIGISYGGEGFVGSRDIYNETHEEVEKLLSDEFNAKFDEVIVIKNDKVIDYWEVSDDLTE